MRNLVTACAGWLASVAPLGVVAVADAAPKLDIRPAIQGLHSANCFVHPAKGRVACIQQEHVVCEGDTDGTNALLAIYDPKSEAWQKSEIVHCDGDGRAASRAKPTAQYRKVSAQLTREGYVAAEGVSLQPDQVASLGGGLLIRVGAKGAVTLGSIRGNMAPTVQFTELERAVDWRLAAFRLTVGDKAIVFVGGHMLVSMEQADDSVRRVPFLISAAFVVPATLPWFDLRAVLAGKTSSPCFAVQPKTGQVACLTQDHLEMCPFDMDGNNIATSVSVYDPSTSVWSATELMRCDTGVWNDEEVEAERALDQTTAKLIAQGFVPLVGPVVALTANKPADFGNGLLFKLASAGEAALSAKRGEDDWSLPAIDLHKESYEFTAAKGLAMTARYLPPVNGHPALVVVSGAAKFRNEHNALRSYFCADVFDVPADAQALVATP